MATSTPFDQSDILTYLLGSTVAPFTLVLCTNPPAGTESIGSVGATTYPSYANVTVLSSAFGSQSVVNGATQVSNSAAITFVTPTGNGTLAIAGFALFDKNNNMRRFGALQTPLPAPQTGQPVEIPIGYLVLAEG